MRARLRRSTSVNTKQPTLNELQQSHDLASSVKIEQQQQQNTSKIISGEMQGNLIQLPVNRPASGLASLLLNIDETPPSASAAPLSVATPPPHALNNDLNDVLVALDSIRPSEFTTMCLLSFVVVKGTRCLSFSFSTLVNSKLLITAAA